MLKWSCFNGVYIIYISIGKVVNTAEYCMAEIEEENEKSTYPKEYILLLIFFYFNS